MRQQVGSTLIGLPLMLGELFGGAIGREVPPTWVPVEGS